MAEAKTFDVVVVGGGPGGYIAAIRAAQLGFTVGMCRRVEEQGGWPRTRWYLHQHRLHPVEGTPSIL